LSDYWDWEQLEHSEEWILYPDNIGERLCLDEVSLSDGELYTVLTNAKPRTQKGSLIAMIKGVKSSDITDVISKIPVEKRDLVKEISVDMANNMEKAARASFSRASIVTDRFHVAKLVNEAVQEIRIKYRWEAIEEENNLIKKSKEMGVKYETVTFENGDTTKQLLARSRYLLFKSASKWTTSQKKRADILFREYPDIKKAYELSMRFRNIYELAKSKNEAEQLFLDWYKKVIEKDYPAFITASQSILNHKEHILNFFVHRTTNALAETFNSKIKAFRASFRGVRDLSFFLYRVSLIFA
jgi:transposase